jgi:hypothetical protein
MVVGGARCSGEGVPLRCAFRGGVDEAMVAALRGIMLRLLLALMVLYSGAIGEFGSFFVEVRDQICVACQVMRFLPFCFKDAGCAAGAMVGGRLDLARSPFGCAGRRWRARIQGLEELGRGPGRWATADGCIPFSRTGVYFDSSQSRQAMEFFQSTVAHNVLFGSSGW